MDKQKDSKFKKVILLLSILAVILAILVVLMLIILDPNVSAITFKSSFDDFQGIMVVAIVLITLFIVSKNTILGSEDTTRILQSLLTKLREQEAQSITMKIPDSEPKQPVEKQLINKKTQNYGNKNIRRIKATGHPDPRRKNKQTEHSHPCRHGNAGTHKQARAGLL